MLGLNYLPTVSKEEYELRYELPTQEALISHS